MIPIMQTKFTNEDRSVRGNCMAACVASLIEVSIGEIPAWEDMGSDGSWGDSFNRFLEEHGYSHEGMIVQIDFSVDWWSALLEMCLGIDGYFIVGGESPRPQSTTGHAVIFKDGAMVHDPHPSGTGILTIKEVYMIEPMKGA